MFVLSLFKSDTFSKVLSIKDWPPKPGLTDIISTIKHFGLISSKTLTGVVKFSTIQLYNQHHLFEK